MTAVADVLDRAAERVSRGWTQGTWARVEGGGKARPGDERAVCWCALGAIYCEVADDDEVASAAIARARDVIDGEILHKWNDAPGRQQSEVVAALREAARRAREVSS